MATIADPIQQREPRPDRLSGTPRAHALDRWIYVFTAASFIAIILAGFIPSSLAKLAMVEAGTRPPLPLVMHVHALTMGGFLLLLFAQTVLVATGREAYHRKLGLLAMLLAPMMVVAGFLLALGNWHATWNAALADPQLQPVVRIVDDILLLQLRIGILFPIFLFVALRARGRDAGLHKRMMILATAIALPAGIDRIPWLWTTMPVTPAGPDLWTLVAISPMLLWDLARNRYLHRAYWIWLAWMLPFTIFVHAVWDTEWWHATARAIMGV